MSTYIQTGITALLLLSCSPLITAQTLFTEQAQTLTVGPEAVPNHLIIKFKPSIQAFEHRQQLYTDLNVIEVTPFALTGAELWKLPEHIGADYALDHYKHNQYIEYIEPDYIIRLENTTIDNPNVLMSEHLETISTLPN
ncbi:MAG: hypothetical protein SVR94_16250, partial [Pseudomonadota bacterium]|nr:hypothetical protein [Pseudomonadota bacterium]